MSTADSFEFCDCGAQKSAFRFGCDECERQARIGWALTVEAPKLPDGWARRFEPEWSCGPYFIYTRAVPFVPEGEIHPSNANDFSGDQGGWRSYFGACEIGVVTPAAHHYYSGEAADVVAIIAIAYAEHRLLRHFEHHHLKGEVARVAAARKAATS